MENMRLFKRAGWWYIELQRGRKKSLKTKDAATARLMAKEMSKGNLVNVKRLSHFIAEYLDHRAATVAATTVREDRLALKELLNCFGDLRMERLDRNLEDLRRHLGMRFTSPWTRNKVMRHIKTALKYARRRGYCSPPLEDLKAFPVDMSKPIYLERHEVAVFIAWARGDHGQVRGQRKGKGRETCLVNHEVMGVAVPIMFYTGISRAEIAGTLAVYPDRIQYRRKKTGRLITVPVAEGLTPYIRHLPRGLQRIVPWQNARTLSWHFQMIAEAAGFPHMTPHKVRHTMATLMHEKGVALETISEILGHADTGVTKRFYAHVGKGKKTEAVNALKL